MKTCPMHGNLRSAFYEVKVSKLTETNSNIMYMLNRALFAMILLFPITLFIYICYLPMGIFLNVVGGMMPKTETKTICRRCGRIVS
jgi:hypothetical protein